MYVIFVLGEEDNTGLARQTLQESFQRRQQSLSSVKRDAGEDVVFRAVPVVVSPTLSLAMKMNAAEVKPKAPLSWASELTSNEVHTSSATKTTAKQEPKKEAQKWGKPVTSTQKTKQNLNPALQPRSAGSIPSPPSGSSSVGQAKSAGIISLGEFLKRQVSNDDSNNDNASSAIPQKNSAVVTTKNKPGPSINSKPASPSKTNPSFYGRAKESAKTPSFSIGKKATNGPSVSSKPGIYSGGKSQGSKPSANSHMSKTLSSWKKSRAVKSGTV